MRNGAVQCGDGVVELIEPGQDIGSSGVEVHVAVEVAGQVVRLWNCVKCRERSGGSVHLVDGDRPVQCDECAELAVQERVVEAQDCSPVGGLESRRRGVQGRNCCLELKGSSALE